MINIPNCETESEALKMLYDKNFTSMSIEQRDPSIIHVSTDILKMTSHCFAIQTNSSKRMNKKNSKSNINKFYSNSK
jgi:hypothetical protein